MLGNLHTGAVLLTPDVTHTTAREHGHAVVAKVVEVVVGGVGDGSDVVFWTPI